MVKTISDADWGIVLGFYGAECLKCHATKLIQKDHVVPLSLGGPDDVMNVQPLCKDCNNEKGNTYADYRTMVPPKRLFGAAIDVGQGRPKVLSDWKMVSAPIELDLLECVDDFAATREISRSEAIRTLLRQAIEGK